jgi:hypothetical protein
MCNKFWNRTKCKKQNVKCSEILTILQLIGNKKTHRGFSENVSQFSKRPSNEQRAAVYCLGSSSSSNHCLLSTQKVGDCCLRYARCCLFLRIVKPKIMDWFPLQVFDNLLKSLQICQQLWDRYCKRSLRIAAVDDVTVGAGLSIPRAEVYLSVHSPNIRLAGNLTLVVLLKMW